MAVTTEGGSVDPGPDGQGDETPFDASPRPRAPRRRRTVLVTVALIAAVAGLVIIAVRSLGDASLFFLNADEAVAQREELGDDRFRLQGTVMPDSVVEEDGTVRDLGIMRIHGYPEDAASGIARLDAPRDQRQSSATPADLEIVTDPLEPSTKPALVHPATQIVNFVP